MTNCIVCGVRLAYHWSMTGEPLSYRVSHQAEEYTELTVEDAIEITGGLSTTSKMPCKSYSLPSSMCMVGSMMKSVAGSVCEKCYTYRYKRYAHVVAKQHERMRSILHPRWCDAMVVLLENEHNEFFRWHDSGDIMTVRHLEKIVEVATRTPDIKHWLPTLETQTLKRFIKLHGKFDQFTNLNIRVSTPMVDGRPNLSLASKMGVTSSSVTANKLIKIASKQKLYTEGYCPASKQNNECGKCRKCWNKEEQLVTYIQH